MISVCFLFFKIPLPRGGSYLPLSFPQALSTEFRVHWIGGHAQSAQTGLRWSPGPMNSFFRVNEHRGEGVAMSVCVRAHACTPHPDTVKTL